MKRYKPKSEKEEIIKQLLAAGIKVTAADGNIMYVDCEENQLTQVQQITNKEYVEVK